MLMRLGRGITIQGGGNGGYPLRGAIVQASFDPDGLTLLGVLEKFPTNLQLEGETIQHNGERIVVTPRRGKAIEINALWYNALLIMSELAGLVGESSQEYDDMAAITKQGFQRFWYPEMGYCYDVIDVFDTPGLPDGSCDDSLRPNQILAVSLPHSPLTPPQQQAVVDICEQFLLTPYGLRSLSPNHPQYLGNYGGNQYSRDKAYHQGTVWGWLIGPFVSAHLRVYQNPTQALAMLESFAQHLWADGLGTISEIFDGDYPHHPRGCIAQAWSVGEVLRVWTEVQGAVL